MLPSDLGKVLEHSPGTDEDTEKDGAREYDFAGRKKVLLDEENALNRKIACGLPAEYGFGAAAAAGGTYAVEIMKNAKPGGFDIVLMDIKMPETDGYEATRLIRKTDGWASKVPLTLPTAEAGVLRRDSIIAMTANAFGEDRRAAPDAGMNEHAAIPIDIYRSREIFTEYI